MDKRPRSFMFSSEDGGYRATRRYFEANPNQMPVRYVRIDPGDGSDGYSPGSGSYPNHRGNVDGDPSPTVTTLEEVCKSPTDAEHFGVSTEACVSKDFRFRTNYNCPSGSENVLPLCSGGANPTNNSYESLLNARGCWDPEADACIFRPRIQVQDNWGYCTNAVGKTCTDGVGGDLCYDDTGGENDTNECEESESWVPFAGRIVVTPP